ncbi:MAG TPA: alpha/beta hydrolase-fold protein [Solirubrobacteraceae bacterium]|jgi:enterochelin esterase-like enzyme|nr:alpha/beta hydrolase-fold protein [Solirubrobacteraceae bacterium]
MSDGRAQSRTQVWMESLGDWSWPGQGGPAAVAGRAGSAAEALPPAWIPALPPRREAIGEAPPARPAQRPRLRAILIGVLLSALAIVTAALALGVHLPARSAELPSSPVDVAPASLSLQPLPHLTARSHDTAGSSIMQTSYPSVALGHHGSFLVYLPPGYSATHAARYPVLYLLHGNSQPATTFLDMGTQGELDTLIADKRIPPLIAVMIQGGSGANNWRNLGAWHFESYVLEVQELVDRMLPTVASRSGRAIAGDSMGGYGAMKITLANPYRFGVVESWLGFFNGLDGQLRIDRPAIKKLGLRAFIYGGAQDTIADPSEDAPFAASLASEGARAQSAVYPGEHTVGTLEAHLSKMLTFAGQALRAGTAVRR